MLGGVVGRVVVVVVVVDGGLGVGGWCEGLVVGW